MTLKTLTTFEPPRWPIWHGVAPPGWSGPPFPEAAPVFDCASATLEKAVRGLPSAEPRIGIIAIAPVIHLTQATPVLRFVDDIFIELFSYPDGRTSLAMVSQSRFGAYDFGVNRRRVHRWLHILAEHISNNRPVGIRRSHPSR